MISFHENPTVDLSKLNGHKKLSLIYSNLPLLIVMMFFLEKKILIQLRELFNPHEVLAPVPGAAGIP